MNWSELYSPEVLKTLGAFVGMGVVALVSAKDLKRQKERNLKEFQDALHRKAVNVRAYYKAKQLDSTKRKSLQPQNQNPIPNGWTDEDEEQWLEANKTPEIDFADRNRPTSTQLTIRGYAHDMGPREYGHKFFGSRLLLDDQVIKGGLTNKLHNLEITKGNVLYIDGQQVSIHPQDLIKLKTSLDKLQNPTVERDEEST